MMLVLQLQTFRGGRALEKTTGHHGIMYIQGMQILSTIVKELFDKAGSQLVRYAINSRLCLYLGPHCSHPLGALP